jgi:ferritin-like metal-binding protein YciE
MPKEKQLEDLFHETLKDIYFVEKQISARSSEDGKSRQLRRVEPGL